MKTFIFQALVGLVILQSVPAFMVSFGSSRLGEKSRSAVASHLAMTT